VLPETNFVFQGAFSIDLGPFYAFLGFYHRGGFIWKFEPGNP